MTGAEALRLVAARLEAGGIEGAGRDARHLVAHVLGVAYGRLTLHLADAVDAGRLEPLVAARLCRQPMSQILGVRLFWGREFRVTVDVLDPRPETEVLVALALREGFARVLDLGTGSGAILLSLLAERPGTTGLGSDLSAAALAVARGNAAALGLAGRAAFHQADWFAGLDGRFDLIVSNPPYVAEAEMAGLAPEVRDWEPHLALTPGGDGLDAYRAIAAGVRGHLTPGGRLMVEIGPTQGLAVTGLFLAAGLVEVAVHPDLDGRDRVVSATAPAV